MKVKAKAARKRPHRRYGWHIVGPDKRLNYNDGRLVKVGKTLSCTGTPRLCHNGMHAAPTVKDCMFEPVLRKHKANAEPWLCRVVVGHASRHATDKFVGKSRRVVWMRRLTKKLLLRVAKHVDLQNQDHKKPKQIWVDLWSHCYSAKRPAKSEAWFIAWAKRTGCPKIGLP